MRFVAIFFIISFGAVAVLVQGNGQEGGSGSGNESGRRGPGDNLIIILHAAFGRVDPKIIIRY